MTAPKDKDDERADIQTDAESLKAWYDYVSKQEGYKGSVAEDWVDKAAIDINARDVANKLDIDPDLMLE